MDVRAAMFFGGDWRVRFGEALGRNAEACDWRLPAGATLATPPGPIDHGFVGGKASRKSQLQHRIMAFTSSGASVCGRRERSIRKNIIGHNMPVFPEGFSSGNLLLRLLRVFPLLHQPARQQGRHLRKPEYGGYAVEKQPRPVARALRGEDFGTVWEYQLRRAIRRKLANGRARAGATRLSLRTAAR